MEVQDHGIAEEKSVNPLMAKLAKDLKLKLVATNDSHFTNKEDAIAQDAMLCLQTNKLVKDYPRMHFTGTEYLKNPLDWNTQLYIPCQVNSHSQPISPLLNFLLRDQNLSAAECKFEL